MDEKQETKDTRSATELWNRIVSCAQTYRAGCTLGTMVESMNDLTESVEALKRLWIDKTTHTGDFECFANDISELNEKLEAALRDRKKFHNFAILVAQELDAARRRMEELEIERDELESVNSEDWRTHFFDLAEAIGVPPIVFGDWEPSCVGDVREVAARMYQGFELFKCFTSIEGAATEYFRSRIMGGLGVTEEDMQKVRSKPTEQKHREKPPVPRGLYERLIDAGLAGNAAEAISRRFWEKRS